MRKRLLLILLLLCSPAWAAFTCQQGATGCIVTTNRTCSSTATSCAITVTSTHAHAVEVICGQSANTAATLSSASDGGFTVPANAKATDVGGGMDTCAYNLNATGGATTITCTYSVSADIACVFFEFTSSAGTPTFDTANNVDDTTCTSCNGATLTLTTTNNYLLIQGAGCGGTCSAINQSYTGVFITGDGAAFKMNQPIFGTTPAWTMTSSTMAGSGLAIYELAGNSPNCGFQGTVGFKGIVGCK